MSMLLTNCLLHFQNYIARFGHGSAKLARQAQSKEKTLAKMVAGGLTEKVSKERSLTFYFPDCGTIPPPVSSNTNFDIGRCFNSIILCMYVFMYLTWLRLTLGYVI